MGGFHYGAARYFADTEFMNLLGATQHRIGLVSLVVLTAAFFGRVAAQLTQRFAQIDALPEFVSWQSGALPYPALVVSQVAILVAMVWVISRVHDNSLDMARRTSLIVAGLGVFYFVSMLVRMVIGLTVGSGHSWWDAPLPTIFHLVLASFVLVTAFVGRSEQ